MISVGKNKLRKFAEMETFPNVFQFTCSGMDADAKSHPHPMAGHWRDTFFHNDHPIVLELGCGRGDYTVGLAAAHPERNYIGIDIKGARMWAGARQAVQQGMTNVAFLRTNIEIINLFFAPSEVDEIWITFPDPQMKKATKRLTSTWFMARYARLLRPGGRIHLKTDSPFLYTYTRAMIETNRLPLLADTDDLYNAQCVMRNAQWGEALDDEHCALSIENCAFSEATLLQTHYERQWLDRGMTIKYLCWQLFNAQCGNNAQCAMRNAQFADDEHCALSIENCALSEAHCALSEALTEPDIEIEHDTYRSYGRNYN